MVAVGAEICSRAKPCGRCGPILSHFRVSRDEAFAAMDKSQVRIPTTARFPGRFLVVLSGRVLTVSSGLQPKTRGNRPQVSLQWKNPEFLFKNPDFLLKHVDFLLKHVEFIIKTQDSDEKTSTVVSCPICEPAKFVMKTRNCLLKTRHCAFKMMSFAGTKDVRSSTLGQFWQKFGYFY